MSVDVIHNTITVDPTEGEVGDTFTVQGEYTVKWSSEPLFSIAAIRIELYIDYRIADFVNQAVDVGGSGTDVYSYQFSFTVNKPGTHSIYTDAYVFRVIT